MYQDYAKSLIFLKNREKEWQCLFELWNRESHWNPKAKNPRSTAYGIPQLLDLEKGTDPFRQIDLGYNYILARYKTPCNALRFHKWHGYY